MLTADLAILFIRSIRGLFYRWHCTVSNVPISFRRYIVPLLLYRGFRRVLKPYGKSREACRCDSGVCVCPEHRARHHISPTPLPLSCRSHNEIQTSACPSCCQNGAHVRSPSCAYSPFRFQSCRCGSKSSPCRLSPS